MVFFGGLPDDDNGNWHKNLKVGEEYSTPKAYITVGIGKINKIARRLQARKTVDKMPIIYNEWATTWGAPNEKIIHESVKLLCKHHIQTYVIDAGWYESPTKDFNAGIGDWDVDYIKFPNGLKKVVDDIHSHNMKAGIWFEFEGIGENSKAYHDKSILVTRKGWPVTTIKRRFLNLMNPKAKIFIKNKLINRLRLSGFDYLKVDYNDSIGIGADGFDSDAEGLQKIVSETLNIFQELHGELPNLVIENCSSGGHRLTIPFIEKTDLSSFSDAHETASIPIIAANELNVLPAYKNLIWAVIKPEASTEEIQYRLISAFLGRICISGDIRGLTNEQWVIFDKGIEFYERNAKLIANGHSHRMGTKVFSYQNPKGYQISEFSDNKTFEKSNEILLLIYRFEDEQIDQIELPIMINEWEVTDEYGSKGIFLAQKRKRFMIEMPNVGFQAKAFLLKRK